MKALAYLMILGCLHVSPGRAQVFEVASVKANKAGDAGGEGATRESVSHSPDSLTMRNVTLKTCLRWAYDVADYQIAGPGWIGSHRYDILAKAATPASPEQLRVMLQALLASRFKVTLHREKKELPVYELVVARASPKLVRAEDGGDSSMRPGDGDLVFQNYSMAEFADRLPGIPFRVDRTVVDRTGLPGAWNFKLKIADNAAAMKSGFEHADGPAVFDVVRQIGLRLDARKDLLEILVLDSAEKIPLEN
ncbi:MAG: TIGR03435 family protein [Acidobacteriota bacterium]